ncbi:hypothetical protein, partial [Brucella pseudogrignonensis]|uniref:hypothetical protein n=1 Tax=Brucella pseudogrignonensis TaxID=419475 RepID=UPI001AEC923E
TCGGFGVSAFDEGARRHRDVDRYNAVFMRTYKFKALQRLITEDCWSVFRAAYTLHVYKFDDPLN